MILNPVEEKERQYFSPYASFTKDHTRRKAEKTDFRQAYRRDVDKIMLSKAYSRYVDKTQVVYLIDNDHITHRSLHVQLVSNFAKGIGDVLGLNLDLIEAIALGHDVGHPPFGHEGELYLSELAEKVGLKNFQHPIQSCRLFSLIEPLNLCLNVYDGFISHDGAMESRLIEPMFNKSWDDHENDLNNKIDNPVICILPATLEGALVKFCDTISYVGRDFEDAIQLKIISREELPDTSAGKTNEKWLEWFYHDIIRESLHKPFMALSEEGFQILKEVRNFNFNKIYNHPRLKIESAKIKWSYSLLFEWLLSNYLLDPSKSHLHTQFLHSKNQEYLESTPNEKKVIDYISGMTDNYFVKTLEKLILPKKIESFY